MKGRLPNAGCKGGSAERQRCALPIAISLFTLCLETTLAPLSTFGQAEDRPPKAESPPAVAKGRPTLNDLTLPPEAILVLCEKAGDVLRALPKAVVLSPEKYQDLLDRLAMLEKAARAQKPTPISICTLTGKIE